MYYVLVLILSWGNPSMVVVDNIPGLETCKMMGDDFVKAQDTVFVAKYVCIPRYSR